MRRRGVILSVMLALALLIGWVSHGSSRGGSTMELGQFSISLAVKNLAVSRDFYTKLGFEVVPGLGFQSEGHSDKYNETWVILEREGAMIGLFQGMFETNTLTFNPLDVRSIQASLKSQGVKFEMEADEGTEGPAAAFLLDPDGNPILLEEHARQPSV